MDLHARGAADAGNPLNRCPEPFGEEGKEKMIMMVRDARTGQFEWRNTIAPLLGDCVALVAMKDQRAPLPVSCALWKGLVREGFPNDLDELATFARRYLFLGDERLLLAELRMRTATTPRVRETLSKESEIAAEERPQIADAHKCQ